jgi:hypothetical protein
MQIRVTMLQQYNKLNTPKSMKNIIKRIININKSINPNNMLNSYLVIMNYNNSWLNSNN